MPKLRIKRYLAFVSLAVAVFFAALWIRSYWYDMYLGYKAPVTQAHVNHLWWTFTDSGAFVIGIQRSVDPDYKREHGAWSFYDYRKEPYEQPPDFILLDAPVSSYFEFLGFRHWVIESQGYHINSYIGLPFWFSYTWIPFWFLVLLFVLPALRCFIHVRRKDKAMTPNKALQPTATAPSALTEP
jgi:hypothetical protein